jgi:hypothetical protein
VDEEAVERILVNLVRNAAAAMHRPHDPPLGTASVSAAQRSVVLRTEDGTGDDTPGAILIGVGHLVNRVDDPKPWPLRRVRLTVEDSGCGMTQEQLDRIVCGDRAPSRGSHGIGFRVVRELVSASNGDLRVMSAPGIGTRVQIEWPVTQMVHEIAVGTNAASYGVKDSSQLAAASVVVASAVAGRVRERQGARAMQASRAVAVDAGPTFRIDSAVGEERDTVC